MLPRIALVEDDEDLLASMYEYLTICGYQVLTANSLEKFYQRLIDQPIDIVLLDIGLPGESGLSLLNHLNQSDNDYAFDIIVLSASNSDADKLFSLKQGANRFLSKPINMEELIANIEAVSRTRQKHFPFEPKTCWTVYPSLLELSTPQNKQVELTHRESLLLEHLAMHQGFCHRDGIALLFNLPSGSYHYARMDVMLSRLRKKVLNQTQEALPLKAVPINHIKFFEAIGVVK
ncbi:hypothetical protein CYQ88_10625 [Hydrogenovibrio sp. SC-1]|uniref:response regulator transcription factor n=1 Tax=Hydrogenovibrio sp. SC-1 TaxID=2065820 RepID=UPI000C7A3403|nr:response regulator transcription factor [Hydrogenovibrio sp. SC-1]PLA73553.1 hypothetical protein CYQ88_10625 [Hydrogenovibrio sp. SC-1]